MKNRTKKLVSLTIFLILLGIGLALWFKPKADVALRLKAEQEVYSVMLSINNKWKVEHFTSLGSIGFNSKGDFSFDNLGFHCGFLSYFTNSCTSSYDFKVSRDIIINLRENNRENYSLTDYLLPEDKYYLLSPNHNEGLWSHLSRIGFNSSLTEAIVLWGTVFKQENNVFYCDQYYYIFEKVNRSWVLQNHFQTVSCHPTDY